MIQSTTGNSRLERERGGSGVIEPNLAKIELQLCQATVNPILDNNKSKFNL